HAGAQTDQGPTGFCRLLRQPLLRCVGASMSGGDTPQRGTALLPLLGRSTWSAVAPGALLLVWWLTTKGRPASLVPPPAEVGRALWDLGVGGLYDDAFSATLLTHLLASASRVYGGFLLAALAGVPMGLLIGRIALVRSMLEPTLQMLRPVPVTAWLPLAMILF